MEFGGVANLQRLAARHVSPHHRTWQHQWHRRDYYFSLLLERLPLVMVSSTAQSHLEERVHLRRMHFKNGVKELENTTSNRFRQYLTKLQSAN